MNPHISPLERAFELARSGKFSTVAEIKKQMVKESVSTAQVTGISLTRQLSALMRAANGRTDNGKGI
jgi:hypothetical protein